MIQIPEPKTMVDLVKFPILLINGRLQLLGPRDPGCFFYHLVFRKVYGNSKGSIWNHHSQFRWFARIPKKGPRYLRFFHMEILSKIGSQSQDVISKQFWGGVLRLRVFFWVGFGLNGKITYWKHPWVGFKVQWSWDFGLLKWVNEDDIWVVEEILH